MSDAAIRCQETTPDPRLTTNLSVRRSVWCELPHGHAGMHHAILPNPDGGPAGSMDWPGHDGGVWMYAHEIPHEGITMAVPYATEVDALRAANAGDYGRVVFVPFGTDLKDVLR